MKIKFVEIMNFRKLKSSRIDFSSKETIFVGANNSGKTSAIDALILFLKDPMKISTLDFTLTNWCDINKLGIRWAELEDSKLPEFSMEEFHKFTPTLDVWIEADDEELHYISHLIPTLDWKGGLLGVRLILEPKDIDELYINYTSAFNSSKELCKCLGESCEDSEKLDLWPKSLHNYLEKKLHTNFCLRSYILDPKRYEEPENGVARSQSLLKSTNYLQIDPFKGLLKIDIINAQRGFSDPNTSESTEYQSTVGNLSNQFREYYAKHLNPSELPDSTDIEALQAIGEAQTTFDKKLKVSFSDALKELEELGYPGFSNPKITLSSKVNPIDLLKHSASVLFDVVKSDKIEYLNLKMPEKYNGLGYQNLISMVFKLIRFRDEWMKVGKSGKSSSTKKNHTFIEPLHLVIVEEPEAHLHAQVQQVFIRKAYEVLRNHKLLGNKKQFSTQLIVSTHSNHIAHETDFVNLRYFRRLPANAIGEVPTSNVVNLSQVFGSEDDTTRFATRYLKTTHCDLFFADAAILVEGPTERMLVPHFIHYNYPQLDKSYISVLEIGGSHAHRLRPLIENLGLRTLIITDLDSIGENSDNKVLPLRGANLRTGNSTLKTWLPQIETLDLLLEANNIAKCSTEYPIRVAYQFAKKIKYKKIEVEVIPYTFEDNLVFENIHIFETLKGIGLIKKFNNALEKSDVVEASKEMFEALKKGKKAEFALELLFLNEPENLKVPSYIDDGLVWLEEQLKIFRNENINKFDEKSGE